MSIRTNDCIQGRIPDGLNRVHLIHRYQDQNFAQPDTIDNVVRYWKDAVRVSGSRNAKHASETQLNDTSERRHCICY
jgi:hypothetical protein